MLVGLNGVTCQRSSGIRSKPNIDEIPVGCLIEDGHKEFFINKKEEKIQPLIGITFSQNDNFLAGIEQLIRDVQEANAGTSYFINALSTLFEKFKEIPFVDESTSEPTLVLDVSLMIHEYIIYSSLYDETFSYTTTPTSPTGRKKRQADSIHSKLFDDDRKLTDYSTIRNLVEQTNAQTNTQQMLHDGYTYLFNRPVSSINFFIRYFNRVNQPPNHYISTGSESEQRCVLTQIYENIMNERDEFLKNTRNGRAEKRNKLTKDQECTIEQNMLHPTSPTTDSPLTNSIELSPQPSPAPLSPSRPTPRFIPQLNLPLTGFVRSTINRLNKQFVQTGSKENKYVSIRTPLYAAASPTLRSISFPIETLTPPNVDTVTPYPVGDWSTKGTVKYRTRRNGKIEREESELNIELISDLTEPEQIAKSLAHNYKIIGAHLVNHRVHMATHVLDLILDDIITLESTKNPQSLLSKYEAKMINVPENHFYDLKGLSNGVMQVYSNKSMFVRHSPLLMCDKSLVCVQLDSPKIFIYGSTDLKCDSSIQIDNDIEYCQNLVPDYCMFAKKPTFECLFVGKRVQHDLNYEIKNGEIYFYDRRRLRQKPFYLNDDELKYLISIVFPFSEKIGGFLDSLAYKGYMFGVHILLVIFLLVKGIIKFVKWINKRLRLYRETKERLKIEKDRQKFERMKLFYETGGLQERDRLNLAIESV